MNSKVENLCCQNSQQNQRVSAEQWIQSEVDREDTGHEATKTLRFDGTDKTPVVDDG